MSAQAFLEYVATVDRTTIQPVLAEADKARAEIIQKFPLDQFATLPLERFAVGKNDKTTLCYLLEFGSDILGSMSGGSADKLGVYFHRKSNSWRSAIPSMSDPQTAWEALRADFLECIALGKEGMWEKIDTLPAARHTAALRTKWLHIHFPDEVINIYSFGHLKRWIELFGGSCKNVSGSTYSATANRQFVTMLRVIPALAGRSLREIGHLLYTWPESPLRKEPQEKTGEEKGAEKGSPPTREAKTVFNLNQILYGPPGTGKTYEVIRRAAEIVEGHEIPDEDHAKACFDESCRAGRIRFATFHQSFSYEDFVEGIRPVFDESEATGFRVSDGILKRLATLALFESLEHIGSKVQKAFDSHWSALIIQMVDDEGNSELSIPGLGGSALTLSFTNRGNIEVTNSLTKKQFLCSRAVLAKVWEACHPKKTISTKESRLAYGKPAHHHVIAAVYNYLQTLKPLNVSYTSLEDETTHASIVQNYYERGASSGWQLRTDGNYPPYVLVIDEINRGNISRIFGELITLIEDDKREGAETALRVTLPSSRELFAVPPNLYILGTMNTADKSLALLDVALRRRFEFEELAPDFNVCVDLPKEMKAVLNRLNERIELRKDRDHRIGHAFFMSVKDAEGFNRVFRRKVVPLLQEYFFNDIDGARFVLGEEAQSSEKGFLRPLKAQVESKYQRNRWRWFTDEEPGMDCWTVLNANLANS